MKRTKVRQVTMVQSATTRLSLEIPARRLIMIAKVIMLEAVNVGIDSKGAIRSAIRIDVH